MFSVHVKQLKSEDSLASLPARASSPALGRFRAWVVSCGPRVGGSRG
jgi:hypothetical protein